MIVFHIIWCRWRPPLWPGLIPFKQTKVYLPATLCVSWSNQQHWAPTGDCPALCLLHPLHPGLQLWNRVLPSSKVLWWLQYFGRSSKGRLLCSKNLWLPVLYYLLTPKGSTQWWGCQIRILSQPTLPTLIQWPTWMLKNNNTFNL